MKRDTETSEAKMNGRLVRYYLTIIALPYKQPVSDQTRRTGNPERTHPYASITQSPRSPLPTSLLLPLLSRSITPSPTPPVTVPLMPVPVPIPMLLSVPILLLVLRRRCRRRRARFFALLVLV